MYKTCNFSIVGWMCNVEFSVSGELATRRKYTWGKNCCRTWEKRIIRCFQKLVLPLLLIVLPFLVVYRVIFKHLCDFWNYFNVLVYFHEISHAIILNHDYWRKLKLPPKWIVWFNLYYFLTPLWVATILEMVYSRWWTNWLTPKWRMGAMWSSLNAWMSPYFIVAIILTSSIHDLKIYDLFLYYLR